MTVKFLLYIVIAVLVTWATDSININQIFKKNKVLQARVFYFLLILSITYLVTNALYDFYLSY